jgi:kumamolisin
MAHRKIFHDSVGPLPAPGPERPADGPPVAESAVTDGNESISLLFSLTLPAEAAAQLEAAVARGIPVRRDELHTRFAVPREQVDRLAEWLRAQGFEVTGISPDGTGVRARAPVSRIERSLDVKMVPVTVDGRRHLAARNAPSLPAEVAHAVHAIIGLQPYRKAHRHQTQAQPPESAPGDAEGAAPAEEGNPPPVGYLVRDLLRAYNADSLGMTGAGQTIAILIDSFPLASDLQTFWEQNGIPVDLGRVVKVGTGQDSDSPDGEEASIDVEWSSGIAPGAQIRVYVPPSLNKADLICALDQILADLPSQPGMHQLSMSFGLGELYEHEVRGEIQAQHQRFLKLAAAGVNVFVSSGDGGSCPNRQGQTGGGLLQVSYASSDPMVVAVGGTSLTLAADSTVQDETAWTDSGGGVSTVFARPPYQAGLNVPGSTRLVPDVSLAADRLLGGYAVSQGIPFMAGGTSWGTPMWAGFCALMNEAREKEGRPPLAFLNPLLYPLLGTPAFRDIQQGSNGKYQAGPGYDLVTGLGVPNVAELYRAIP